MMISEINLAMLLLNIFLNIGFLVAFIIIVIVKNLRCYTAFFVGLLTFIVSQIILRVPLNSWFGADLSQNSKWGYLVYMVLTAMIFEEGGRYVGMKFGLKDNKRLIDGFAFGIGFAMGYNILFSTISHVNNFLTAIEINKLGVKAVIDQANGDVMTLSVIDGLLNTTWYKLLIIGIHDIAWLIIEIALSIIVLHAVRLKSKEGLLFFGIAACLHIFMEGVVIFLNEILKISNYKTEIYILCIALVALIFIILSSKSKKEFIKRNINNNKIK